MTGKRSKTVFSVVTLCHCTQCGFKGTIEQCIQDKSIEPEMDGKNANEVIRDLCPDCYKKGINREVEYD